uniref:Nucleobase-ascorbate transporter 12 n=1 Tax=Kalanchoe fedtschenkoi TaxID=63787 RepID=A0A7N0VBU9_KALFE
MASSDPTGNPPPPAVPPTSWAKRTGFKPRLSGETNVGHSGQIAPPPRLDLEAGGLTAPLPSPPVNGQHDKVRLVPPPSDKDEAVRKKREGLPAQNANGGGPLPVSRRSESVDALPQTVDDSAFMHGHSLMRYELRDTPGLVPIGLYGLQHYLSMLASLILIPLVIVPAMGGNQDDISQVVSSVLLVSGLTTLLHTSFGTRLPLIQGPSFVYLAPVLAIINSPDFLKQSGLSFKHYMKELQGAIIISSGFQAVVGYSGLITVLLRFINPVVVAPTIAAVGLSFYSYGFPQVGTCLEIGAAQIVLLIVFSLYLRKVSIFGHRVFLIYAIPLGLAITWAAAFLLTEAGVYSYKGCDVNVPASNMVSAYCRSHLSKVKHCRVDTSHALRSSPWFRVPYPLQWGTPVFGAKSAIIMCVASLISSVDSVGSYHASSLLVASRPPTPGVVSRGIGLEGISSILAGLWGTGTASSTLTENVHTIAVTKMGSRRAVELGACILIVLSLCGKVGGFIASIPQVMVAGLLCFMWAMLAALGLSNLRYSEAGSSRNIIIVGLSLFFSLTVPAYFQQYGISPRTNLSVPSYFEPYIVASHGPFQSKYGGVNYIMNTLLSFQMVVAFLMAFILDNTVPGSRQERGVYVWSDPETARREPAVTKDYELPFKLSRLFRWVKCVGL